MIPEVLPFVTSVIPGQEDGNLYYGINISSNAGLEPIDQLDGFLVASYIQRASARKFFPYLAGVYNVLNARSPDEARKTAAKKLRAEQQKKLTLQNIMSNLGLQGSVLTTYDMWDHERYWQIVDRLFSDGIYDAMPLVQKMKGSMKFESFPCEILGKMQSVTRNIPGVIEVASLYLPAEVAEAVWLREMHDVAWKIGPSSEEIYDRFIRKEGMGIIRLRQPMALENGTSKEVMPYIGKSTQPLRITFCDTPETLREKCVIGNPSFSEAVKLVDTYNPPVDGEARDYMCEINRLINLGKNR